MVCGPSSGCRRSLRRRPRQLHLTTDSQYLPMAVDRDDIGKEPDHRRSSPSGLRRHRRLLFGEGRGRRRRARLERPWWIEGYGSWWGSGFNPEAPDECGVKGDLPPVHPVFGDLRGVVAGGPGIVALVRTMVTPRCGRLPGAPVWSWSATERKAQPSGSRNSPTSNARATSSGRPVGVIRRSRTRLVVQDWMATSMHIIAASAFPPPPIHRFATLEAATLAATSTTR